MASFTSLVLAINSSFVVNVQDFGAQPVPGLMNTQAFQAAIAAIDANPGGGIIYVPPGTYLTASLNLTSNLELRLDNTTLLAPANFSDWSIIAPLPSYGRGRDFPGPRYENFISCYNCSHVRVTSNYSAPDGSLGASINGQGAAWWAAVDKRIIDVTPGHLLEFLWSDTIEVDHVMLVDSPFWTLHIYSSSFAWVHDMAVVAPDNSRNTDGIDPDSSSDVLIEDVTVDNGDDCIAIKSGWNQAGVAYGVPTQRVTVRRMQCSSPAACLAIGSEMSGGVSDVLIHDIHCEKAGWGALNIKSSLGRGGYVTNVTYANVTLGRGPFPWALGVADNYVDNFPPAPIDPTLIPLLSHVTIRNVTAASTGSGVEVPGMFVGLGTAPSAGLIHNITLVDINLGATTKGWQCGNVTGSSTNVVPAPCADLQQQR